MTITVKDDNNKGQDGAGNGGGECNGDDDDGYMFT